MDGGVCAATEDGSGPRYAHTVNIPELRATPTENSKAHSTNGFRDRPGRVAPAWHGMGFDVTAHRVALGAPISVQVEPSIGQQIDVLGELLVAAEREVDVGYGRPDT